MVDSLAAVEIEVPPAFAVRTSRRASRSEIAAEMGAAFATLSAYATEHALTPAGPPRAMYTSWGEDGIEFTAEFPVVKPPYTLPPAPGVTAEMVAGGRMLRFTHVGSYEHIAQTYERITHWLVGQGLMSGPEDWSKFMPMWEEYLNDPATTPSGDLLTNIYLPKR